MGSSASKFSTGERGDVAGGLLPMEGNRNSKDWGESCLDKLGRFSEGLKEVCLIDQSKKEIVFFACKTCETRILELLWPLERWLAIPYLPVHSSSCTVHSRAWKNLVVSEQSKARMGLIAGLTGASLGTMIVIYTRALRKVALFSSECSSRARADAAALSHTKSTAAHSPLTIASVNRLLCAHTCLASERVHAPSSCCAEPWEHVFFGVIGGWWGVHKLLQAESYCEAKSKELLLAKMERNKVRGANRHVARAPLRSSPRCRSCAFAEQPTLIAADLTLPLRARRVQGTLDEKYRAMLGSSYAKIFPES
jgi:hypothetical protein